MRFSDRYNPLERAIHYVAFCAPVVQRALAELENDLFPHRATGLAPGPEVFVTGLPRAGTTLLLDLLYRTGEFGTFTYRHMPFILSPLISGRLSRASARAAPAIERAHGDGMQVSLDSPEAFEEVIWLAYLRDRIVAERTLEPLATGAVPAQFKTAFRETIRKLLAERESEIPARYLSKNNANISRLGVLSQLFPDSTIVVAFREPSAQAASLVRQHRRFLAAHEAEPFARRYMAWVGHFEFGMNLRPINFAGWLDDRTIDRQPTADFWLQYWTAAYRYALEHRTPNVIFVDFDRLLSERGSYLAAIGAALDLQRPDLLIDQARSLRAPTTRPGAAPGSAEVLETANEVHRELRDAAAALSQGAAA
jgi:hypothetical protein